MSRRPTDNIRCYRSWTLRNVASSFYRTWLVKSSDVLVKIAFMFVQLYHTVVVLLFVSRFEIVVKISPHCVR